MTIRIDHGTFKNSESSYSKGHTLEGSNVEGGRERLEGEWYTSGVGVVDIGKLTDRGERSDTRGRNSLS